MKIEFKNGSVLEIPENVEVVRGKRSEVIEWFILEEDEENGDSE